MKQGGGGCGEISNEVISRLDVLDQLYKDQEQELKDLSQDSNRVSTISNN